jgi:N-acetylmuramoyl-L-alanine amidase
VRRPVRFLGAVVLLLLGAAVRPPGLGDVANLRIWEHPSYTRVVVELTQPSDYETHVLANPPRVYVDIGEVWIDAPLRDPRTLDGNGPVRRVRGGQNTLRKARVVVEMDHAGREHRTFHLRDPFRIVTDVFRERAPGEAPPTTVRSFDLRPVQRVVIDPGHGGKDPGARAKSGLREKDLVLRVARALRERLRGEGFEVFLTRDDDRYLTLERRTEIANQRGADLFVSIHANASKNKRSHGVETYLLDTRYDRQTARVAARENGTTVEALDDLHKILASLRLGYNERFAARLAHHVHGPLVKALRRNHRGTQDLGVKRGPFLVLFTAAMPAILVEVGFVSNRAEADRMKSKKFAEASARGIAQGILSYRDEHARRLLAGR